MTPAGRRCLHSYGTRRDRLALSQDLALTEVVDLQIESFAFSAKTLRVKRWTTVVRTNNDPVRAVDSLDLDATPTSPFNSGPLAGGHTFRHTLGTCGMFFHECPIHRPDPAVHAEVIVQ